MNCGVVRLTRKTEFAYAARRLAVMVDGKRVGFVGNGKTVDFSIPLGSHEIWVSMDWVRSASLHLELQVGSIHELITRLNGGLIGAILKPYYEPKETYILEVAAVKVDQYFRPIS